MPRWTAANCSTAVEGQRIPSEVQRAVADVQPSKCATLRARAQCVRMVTGFITLAGIIVRSSIVPVGFLQSPAGRWRRVLAGKCERTQSNSIEER